MSAALLSRFPFGSKYFIGSIFYGFCRSATNVYDGSVQSYDIAGKTDRRPILLTEKLGIMLLSSFYGPFLTPIWLYQDIERFEIKARGHDLARYGYDNNKTCMDYVFR